MPVRPSPAARPLHAFRPTSGTAVGIAGVVAAALVVVLVAVTERSLFGLRTAVVAALVGLLVWMVLLRPRAQAYADTLVLCNMASDTTIPLASIDSVVVRHTLNVWVGERRYVCPGIGQSTRTMLRSQSRTRSAATDEQNYATFVETTIDDLARAARRDAQGDQPPVRRRWAVAELLALAALLIALGGSFLL